VDVSSEEAMRDLAGDVLAEHGVVDIVVNNAAIAMLPTPTVEVPLDVFRRVMEVNFWGVVHGSMAFLPHLLERPEANLVNVASNASLVAYSRLAPYTAAKFAVRGFTETLRMELRSTPVRVTVICPGLTKTPMFGQSPVIDPDRRRALQSRVDKIWGLPPEAVARAIVRAVEKDRPRALVGPDSKLMDGIARVLPGAHSRLLAPGVNYFMAQFAQRL
jgi:NAD(P)-dependent dehydrogenase (short-subunit alcohol dehydrogenase family)